MEKQTNKLIVFINIISILCLKKFNLKKAGCTNFKVVAAVFNTIQRHKSNQNYCLLPGGPKALQ